MEYYKYCKELPLKIFFEVAETANVHLLLKYECKNVDMEALILAWENIIIEYGNLDKNQSIKDVIDKSDQIYKQQALYVEIQGMLIYLWGCYNHDYVERLAYLGYKIDTSNEQSIKVSVKKAEQRSHQISTRINFLTKDIEQKSKGKKQTFDGVMAGLAIDLGFEPKDDITVLKFIEYKNQIRNRQKK